jgi:hypothetical protein
MHTKTFKTRVSPEQLERWKQRAADDGYDSFSARLRDSLDQVCDVADEIVSDPTPDDPAAIIARRKSDRAERKVELDEETRNVSNGAGSGASR